jgi:hypothetical protein
MAGLSQAQALGLLVRPRFPYPPVEQNQKSFGFTLKGKRTPPKTNVWRRLRRSPPSGRLLRRLRASAARFAGHTSVTFAVPRRPGGHPRARACRLRVHGRVLARHLRRPHAPAAAPAAAILVRRSRRCPAPHGLLAPRHP